MNEQDQSLDYHDPSEPCRDRREFTRIDCQQQIACPHKCECARSHPQPVIKHGIVGDGFRPVPCKTPAAVSHFKKTPKAETPQTNAENSKASRNSRNRVWWLMEERGYLARTGSFSQLPLAAAAFFLIAEVVAVPVGIEAEVLEHLQVFLHGLIQRGQMLPTINALAPAMKIMLCASRKFIVRPRRS